MSACPLACTTIVRTHLVLLHLVATPKRDTEDLAVPRNPGFKPNNPYIPGDYSASDVHLSVDPTISFVEQTKEELVFDEIDPSNDFGASPADYGIPYAG